MSHAAFIALMNNQTDFFNITGDIEYVFNSLESLFTGILSYLSLILIPFCFSEITHVVSTIYTKIFGDNHILAYLSLVTVSFTLTYIINFYKNLFDRLKELEDQVNYAKKKIRMQDGEIEYLLDEKKHNEKKFLTLQKKVQKVNKELKQYE